MLSLEENYLLFWEIRNCLNPTSCLGIFVQRFFSRLFVPSKGLAKLWCFICFHVLGFGIICSQSIYRLDSISFQVILLWYNSFSYLIQLMLSFHLFGILDYETSKIPHQRTCIVVELDYTSIWNRVFLKSFAKINKSRKLIFVYFSIHVYECL